MMLSALDCCQVQKIADVISNYALREFLKAAFGTIEPGDLQTIDSDKAVMLPYGPKLVEAVRDFKTVQSFTRRAQIWQHATRAYRGFEQGPISQSVIETVYNCVYLYPKPTRITSDYARVALLIACTRQDVWLWYYGSAPILEWVDSDFPKWCVTAQVPPLGMLTRE